MNKRSLITSLFVFLILPAVLLAASVQGFLPLAASIIITPFAWTLAAKRSAASKDYQLTFGKACSAALAYRNPKQLFLTFTLFVLLLLGCFMSDAPSICGWIFMMASMVLGAVTGRRFAAISRKLSEFAEENQQYNAADRQFIAEALQVSEQDMQSVAVQRDRDLDTNQLFIYAASEKLSALTPEEIESLLAVHAPQWEAVGNADRQVILTSARELTLHRRALIRQAGGY